MTITKWLGAAAFAAISFGASAAGGLTVINTDSTSYVLVLEDNQEKSWEVTIEPGAAKEHLCSDCYVAIKGQDDFEYGDESTVIRIVDGKLVIQGQE